MNLMHESFVQSTQQIFVSKIIIGGFFFIDMSIYKIKSLQASPDHLMDHLVQEHSAVDPTFVEDFLLCYRIFLKSPMELAYRLQTWFNTSTLRNKVSIDLVRCCYKQSIVSTLIW